VVFLTGQCVIEFTDHFLTIPGGHMKNYRVSLRASNCDLIVAHSHFTSPLLVSAPAYTWHCWFTQQLINFTTCDLIMKRQSWRALLDTCTTFESLPMYPNFVWCYLNVFALFFPFSLSRTRVFRKAAQGR